MDAQTHGVLGPTTVTSTVTTTTRTPHQAPNPSARAPQAQDYSRPIRNAGSGIGHQEVIPKDSYAIQGNTHHLGNSAHGTPGINSVSSGQSPHSNPAPPEQHPDGVRSDPRTYEQDQITRNDGSRELSRQKSIPRKQVGASTQPSQTPVASQPLDMETYHNRQQDSYKALPNVPVTSENHYTSRNRDPVPQSSSILDRSRPISKGSAIPRSGQDVVDRAKTNTYDTSVVEKVAPGK